MQYKDVIVHGWWHSPWSRWVFFLLLLKRGNVFCIDQKLSGFVITGAAVPPTSKSHSAVGPPIIHSLQKRKGLQE